jgi:hypothetical protein
MAVATSGEDPIVFLIDVWELAREETNLGPDVAELSDADHVPLSVLQQLGILPANREVDQRLPLERLAVVDKSDMLGALCRAMPV